MIRVHKLLDSTRVVEFCVARETAQKLEQLPVNHHEEVERKFGRIVALEFDRWQETMV